MDPSLMGSVRELWDRLEERLEFGRSGTPRKPTVDGSNRVQLLIPCVSRTSKVSI